jgi:hypothetical protein
MINDRSQTRYTKRRKTHVRKKDPKNERRSARFLVVHTTTTGDSSRRRREHVKAFLERLWWYAQVVFSHHARLAMCEYEDTQLRQLCSRKDANRGHE